MQWYPLCEQMTIILLTSLFAHSLEFLDISKVPTIYIFCKVGGPICVYTVILPYNKSVTDCYFVLCLKEILFSDELLSTLLPGVASSIDMLTRYFYFSPVNITCTL